jgi:hypothetical protein
MMKTKIIALLVAASLILSACVATKPEKEERRINAAEASVQIAQIYYSAPAEKAAPPGYTFAPVLRPERKETVQPAKPAADLAAEKEAVQGLPGLRTQREK